MSFVKQISRVVKNVIDSSSKFLNKQPFSRNNVNISYENIDCENFGRALKNPLGILNENFIPQFCDECESASELEPNFIQKENDTFKVSSHFSSSCTNNSYVFSSSNVNTMTTSVKSNPVMSTFLANPTPSISLCATYNESIPNNNFQSDKVTPSNFLHNTNLLNHDLGFSNSHISHQNFPAASSFQPPTYFTSAPFSLPPI